MTKPNAPTLHDLAGRLYHAIQAAFAAGPAIPVQTSDAAAELLSMATRGDTPGQTR